MMPASPRKEKVSSSLSDKTVGKINPSRLTQSSPSLSSSSVKRPTSAPSQIPIESSSSSTEIAPQSSLSSSLLFLPDFLTADSNSSTLPSPIYPFSNAPMVDPSCSSLHETLGNPLSLQSLSEAIEAEFRKVYNEIFPLLQKNTQTLSEMEWLIDNYRSTEHADFNEIRENASILIQQHNGLAKTAREATIKGITNVTKLVKEFEGKKEREIEDRKNRLLQVMTESLRFNTTPKEISTITLEKNDLERELEYTNARLKYEMTLRYQQFEYTHARLEARLEARINTITLEKNDLKRKLAHTHAQLEYEMILRDKLKREFEYTHAQQEACINTITLEKNDLERKLAHTHARLEYEMTLRCKAEHLKNIETQQPNSYSSSNQEEDSISQANLVQKQGLLSFVETKKNEESEEKPPLSLSTKLKTDFNRF